jgi:hypothetical protein
MKPVRKKLQERIHSIIMFYRKNIFGGGAAPPFVEDE